MKVSKTEYMCVKKKGGTVRPEEDEVTTVWGIYPFTFGY